MPFDSQLLADRTEIADLLHRYAHAVDRQDWELLTTCFTDDATVDYSASGAPAGTFVEFRDWMAKTMPGFIMTQHFVTNSLVTVTGDEADGRAYFYNPMTMGDGKGGVMYIIVGGYYVDRFRRTPDGWRIAHRKEEVAFMDGPVTHA